jgi:uncharacterized membrane protein YgcG
MDPAVIQQMMEGQNAALAQMQQQLQHQQAAAAQQQAVLLQHLQHMEQQLAAARPAPPAAPVVALAPVVAQHASRPDRPRLSAPAKYAGGGPALDQWLNEMARQFDFYLMTDDGERIRYATVNMEGAAYDWWTHLAAAARPATWALLEAALRTRFQPVNSAELARAKLLALTQGKRSVQDFVDAFRRIVIRMPNMHEEDQLFQFLRGLRPELAQMIRVQGAATLSAAIDMAVRMGAMHDLGARGGALYSHPSGAPGGASGAHAPMELDAIEGLEAETVAGEGNNNESVNITRAQLHHLLNAMRDSRGAGAGRGGGAGANRGGGGRSFGGRGLPSIPGMTPAQVKEYMDDGKCFTCGSKEHRSRQCPKNKGNVAGATNPSQRAN